LRKEWVLRAAAAGKHVVCEKPCAVTVADLREMLDACQRHQVQFMDGVMFMHSRRLERIREVLDDGQSIGQVRRITSAFSYCAPPEFFASNIRAHGSLEPQGCLGDLGWYCIRFALWAMNWQMPQRVSGRLLSEHRHTGSTTPVPTEFSAELLFADGVSAGFYCSFLAENQHWAQISGAKGYLRLDDFVLPFDGHELSFEVQQIKFTTSGGNFRVQPSLRRYIVPEHSQSHSDAQETNLFRNFSNQVRSGHLNPLWPDIALKTQTVLCACHESARSDGKPIRVE
jgi:predicted dehydrogenase